MRNILILMVIALLVAHQDYWNWNDPTLVWNWLPMGLFYHLCISLAAGLVWFLAVTFAWPKSFSDLDAEIARELQIKRDASKTDDNLLRSVTSNGCQATRSSRTVEAIRFFADGIFLPLFVYRILRAFLFRVCQKACALLPRYLSWRREVSR